MSVVTLPFASYAESVPAALDAVGAPALLARQERVLVKPNLVNASPHPVTTHPDHCRALVEYVRAHSRAEVVIAEGCGDAVLDTDDIFEALGYTDLARELDVELLDLNHAPLVERPNPGASVFETMHLPQCAFTHLILSAPVLKVHSLAGVTGTLKNMVGFAPPEFYSGRGGVWKKAVFHLRMQASVMDLNRLVRPQLTVLDASVGLAEYHLGGAVCDPPPSRVVAGTDPYGVDREACRLLGVDWRSVRHVAVEAG